MAKTRYLILAAAFLLLSAGTAGAMKAADTTSDKNLEIETSTVTVDEDSVPVGTIITWTNGGKPKDAEKWIECDGKTEVTKDKYPDLYDMLSGNTNYMKGEKLYVPDMTTRFLRGGTLANAGKTGEDSIKSYDFTVAGHTHTFSNLQASGGSADSLTQGAKVYVPVVDNADDLYTTETEKYTQRVKTGTKQVKCGTKEESYQDCVDKYEDVECGKNRYQWVTCYYLGQNGKSGGQVSCGNKVYKDGAEITGVKPGSSPGTVKVCDQEMTVSGGYTMSCHGFCPQESWGYADASGYQCGIKSGNAVYKLSAWYKCPSSMSECWAELPKYCRQKTGQDCTTKTRTVDKYCEEDVYEDRVMERQVKKKLQATAITTTQAYASGLQGGTVTGKTGKSGKLEGEYSGASETAPQHMYVRYFIRALK